MGDLRTIALCIGGSRAVWAELEAARALIGDRAHVVIATNYAGRFYRGDIDAWATLHPESFPAWRDERAERGFNSDYRALMYYGRAVVPGAEAVRQRWNGSSGLFAAQVAFDAMDCVGAILCGVPLDASAGHFHDAGDWALADRYRAGFHDAKAEGAPIRSMSGWTADLLGRPDAEWLAGLNLSKARKRPRRKTQEAAMRVRFLKDRNWTAPEDRRQTTAYKADMELTVKRTWGEQMVKDGDAVEIDAPPRPVEKKPLTPAQIKALDGDKNGAAGGSLPKADHK